MKEDAKKWFKIAESDFASCEYLFKGAHYPQAIYYLCQSLEKILKASQIEFKDSAPQKIHRLENIAIKSGIRFTKSQLNTLTELSKHYSRVRYPDISKVSYNTKSKVEPIMKKGKELYQWIYDMLKSR